MKLLKIRPVRLLMYLNDLLLDIDGVGDGASIWSRLRVLAHLPPARQSQDLLRVHSLYWFALFNLSFDGGGGVLSRPRFFLFLLKNSLLDPPVDS